LKLFLLICGGLLLLPVVAVRLIFLIRGRLGWINYLANTFSEFFVKKIHWSRTSVEVILVLVGVTLIGVAGIGWEWPLGVSALLLGLELYVSKVERWMLTTSWTPIDPIGLKQSEVRVAKELARGYPTPSTHPELTINLVGPFVQRKPDYELGTLLVGRQFELRLIIGNHTIVPTQTSIRIQVEAPPELSIDPDASEPVPRLEAGQVHEICQRWTVLGSYGAGVVSLTVEWGNFSRCLQVRFDRCKRGASKVASAAITRYPGGCRSAFAWRGDMDLYDESTLQSIEGLELTLGLAARYRMPQTLFLSTRLSLDQTAAQQWAGHYGVDRGAVGIPQFIDWVRENVDLRHECNYPFTTRKRFLIELGNHGHLHFGTDTAGAAENGWRPKSRMGAGVYPVAEQRSVLIWRTARQCFGSSAALRKAFWLHAKKLGNAKSHERPIYSAGDGSRRLRGVERLECQSAT
jgi:hypothetical protein